jgi:hypothetical protein
MTRSPIALVLRAVLPALLALAASRPAPAAVGPPLDEAELVRQADSIVVGIVEHVGELRALTGLVLLRVQVRVIRAWRGARVGDLVTIELPGGEAPVDGAPASPPLVAGSLVLGFLERHNGHERPLAVAASLRSVRLAPGGGLRVYRDPPAGDGARDPPEGERLDELVGRLEGLLRAQAPRAGTAPHAPSPPVSPPGAGGS